MPFFIVFPLFLLSSIHSSPENIWLSNVHCTGNEYSLESCSNSGYGITGNCTHDYDIGIVCSDSKSQLLYNIVFLTCHK